MNEREPQEVSPRPNDGPPKTCTSAFACPLQGRRGLLLWALVIGAIGFMQWPMLKGMYYKTTNAQAPASDIAWRTGFDAAMAESKQTGKPLLVDFTASWCPPCKVMKHEVWPDAEVAKAANERYVPLLVDVDDPANAEVSQRYGIRNIPTILVLDGKGQIVREGSFMSVGGMLDFLNDSAG
jgi:thiol:disulfide interchange protein